MMQARLVKVYDIILDGETLTTIESFDSAEEYAAQLPGCIMKPRMAWIDKPFDYCAGRFV